MRQSVTCYRCAAKLSSDAVLLGAAAGTIGLFVYLQFDQMLVGALAILFWALTVLSMIHFYPPMRESVDNMVEVFMSICLGYVYE